jgi:hypothetical protein
MGTLDGPTEGTSEHRQLEKDVGFSYRQVLGELIHAYVICRLDIGFAVTSLSRFSQAPARDHYMALKNVVRYLGRTIDWGTVYWREKPVDALPAIPLDRPTRGGPVSARLPVTGAPATRRVRRCRPCRRHQDSTIHYWRCTPLRGQHGRNRNDQ